MDNTYAGVDNPQIQFDNIQAALDTAKSEIENANIHSYKAYAEFNTAQTALRADFGYYQRSGLGFGLSNVDEVDYLTVPSSGTSIGEVQVEFEVALTEFSQTVFNSIQEEFAHAQTHIDTMQEFQHYQTEFDNAIAQLNTAQANVNTAQIAYDSAEAVRLNSQSAVDQAEAALTDAKTSEPTRT